MKDFINIGNPDARLFKISEFWDDFRPFSKKAGKSQSTLAWNSKIYSRSESC